jgi:phage repressor protein C with HTH and peptisase S24 domain
VEKSVFAISRHFTLSGNICSLPPPPPYTSLSRNTIHQEAAAGRGITIEDYAEVSNISIHQALIHPHNSAKLKAVFVSGDSMTGEKIFDGDIVISCLKLIDGNAVYVVSVGDTLLVKRVNFDETSQSITLISANPSYPPKVINGKDLGGVKVEWRVVACLHRM